MRARIPLIPAHGSVASAKSLENEERGLVPLSRDQTAPANITPPPAPNDAFRNWRRFFILSVSSDTGFVIKSLSIGLANEACP